MPQLSPKRVWRARANPTTCSALATRCRWQEDGWVVIGANRKPCSPVPRKLSHYPRKTVLRNGSLGDDFTAAGLWLNWPSSIRESRKWKLVSLASVVWAEFRDSSMQSRRWLGSTL